MVITNILVLTKHHAQRDCRISNGRSGYESTLTSAHFLSLGGIYYVVNIKIGWNIMVDQPYHSAPGGTTYLVNATGLPGHPVRLYDNYFGGSYALHPLTVARAVPGLPVRDRHRVLGGHGGQ